MTMPMILFPKQVGKQRLFKLFQNILVIKKKN